MKSFILLSALLLIVFFTRTSSCGLIQEEILTLDCKGRVHFLPGTPFEAHIKAEKGLQLYNVFMEKLMERTKCTCPSITERNFVRQYVLGVEAFLSHNLTNRLDDSCPQQDSGMSFLQNLKYEAFNPPNSCSLSSIVAGKPCLLSYSIGGASLNLAIDQCPADSNGKKNRLPFVSVTCTGAGCSSLFKPCTNNCGSSSLVCTELGAVFSDPSYESFLQTAGIFDVSSGNCNITPTKFFTSLVNKVMVDSFGVSSLVWGSPSICLPGSAEFENGIIDPETGTLNAASSWNGKLSDGSLVNSDSRKAGSSHKIPDPTTKFDDKYVVLLERDCNGLISLLPGSLDLGLYLPTLSPWMEHINSAMNQLRSCDKSWTSALQRTLFQVYQPNGFLYKFTNTLNPFSVGKWTSSPLQAMYEALGSPIINLNTPSTCKFDTYDDKGCSATYTQLVKLFDEDIKIHFSVFRCKENPNDFPGVHVTCEGNMCNALNNAKLCNSNSDCSNGHICLDILEQVSTTKDLWDIALGSSTQCLSSSSVKAKDFSDMVSVLQSKPAQKISSGMKVCMADIPSKIEKVVSWAEGAYVVSGHTAFLPGLVDYAGPAQSNPIASSASSSMITTFSFVVVCIVASFFTLM